MNKPRLLRQAIAASLIIGCSSVYAFDNIINVGSLQSYQNSTYISLINHILPTEPSGTVFNDYFNFSTTGTGGSSVATTLTLSNILDITGLTIALYNGTGAAVGSLVAGPVGSGVTLTASLIAGNPYSVKVNGTTSGLAGGSYSTAISAVPEAETWGMMVAGLGLVGLRLRRKMDGAHRILA